ncbi:helix-turn-helix domain-containing protein [Thermoactinomyces sp. DSM 45892]|uniref:helix-turn-helix domain-containing protein n=1 Tax=Thermoactinomyces sp. DSM 45892 TaxID=1882753 RepID=UPI0008964FC0|nr:helix-turn-helix transcriptional regulator [Thermoactinomyces sp. DSM 45892]SDY70880.1 Transcriptional regulator, contains XRE-family HTH domain [Thermoactinomyces sp. DSM 45892]
MEIFSERLRKLRELRGWTQKEVAEALHVDRKTVTGYESSGRTPRERDILVNLVKLFNTTSDYLFGITDDPSPRREQTMEEKLENDPYLQGILKQIESNRRFTEDKKKELRKQMIELYIQGLSDVD